ncbi:DNA polymerase beta domain protein region [Rhodothermus marinus SG0.5JP17-172]|jgi:predicted nucleotidyltransferase|uniref:type VII toxin-antitoxin system MntA family adenylyltransferase antitoxin n=1 Tax=Rhodothermus marinus TaxID=29549 RepID=UPI000223DC48|nr:nucleotidyltransferase domain-containing protein [Rhodothermus marinus]AEN73156.1 DNA polymerase beta domain protein region [Rhodothermus marinus SG0.5JP17-172]
MPVVDFEAIGRVLARDPNVLAGWVFGSAREGTVRPGGDLDIGVLVEDPHAWDALAELRACLQEATGVDAIDLVVLNEAHPFLQFEAISGREVWCRDRERVTDFVVRVARAYEDAMILLQRGLRMGAQECCRASLLRDGEITRGLCDFILQVA